MIEENLQIFIDTTLNYFSTVTNRKIEVGSPYLVENKAVQISDYTGVIAISGQYTGCCYFTAPRIFLRYLIMTLGEQDTSDAMLLDAVGEIANTLSGNARKELGRDFIISVPSVFKGEPEISELPEDKRTYAIPVLCNSYKALLCISLSQDNSSLSVAA